MALCGPLLGFTPTGLSAFAWGLSTNTDDIATNSPEGPGEITVEESQQVDPGH